MQSPLCLTIIIVAPPDTVLWEPATQGIGAVGDISLATVPKTPPPAPQSRLIGQEVGPGPREAVYWQLSKAGQILLKEFELRQPARSCGLTIIFNPEEQRKEAERRKRQVTEQQR